MGLFNDCICSLCMCDFVYRHITSGQEWSTIGNLMVWLTDFHIFASFSATWFCGDMARCVGLLSMFVCLIISCSSGLNLFNFINWDLILVGLQFLKWQVTQAIHDHTKSPHVYNITAVVRNYYDSSKNAWLLVHFHMKPLKYLSFTNLHQTMSFVNENVNMH